MCCSQSFQHFNKKWFFNSAPTEVVAFSPNISQDFNAFARYIRQFPGDRFLEACSNFHLLLFMATCEILPLHASFDSLLTCVRQKDASRLSAWCEGEEWQTVLQLLEHGKRLTVSFRKFPVTEKYASASMIIACPHFNVRLSLITWKFENDTLPPFL